LLTHIRVAEGPLLRSRCLDFFATQVKRLQKEIAANPEVQTMVAAGAKHILLTDSMTLSVEGFEALLDSVMKGMVAARRQERAAAKAAKAAAAEAAKAGTGAAAADSSAAAPMEIKSVDKSEVSADLTQILNVYGCETKESFDAKNDAAVQRFLYVLNKAAKINAVDKVPFISGFFSKVVPSFHATGQPFAPILLKIARSAYAASM
jgi:hypothetical protein